MENIIEVKNVWKPFKKEPVLKDINLTVKKGSIVGIIGKNGSGKTVLLKIICGLLSPSSGQVIVNRQQVGKDVDFPSDIGIIIEAPGFLPNYSGYKNLQYLAGLKNKISKQDILNTLELVGLTESAKKHVGKYSLGMKQRLGLAQAIMENPTVLILDEPLNGLDSDGIDDISKLLLKMKAEGKTILIVSHHKEDIDVLCDCVYIMEKGVLTQLDTKR